jgi:hypothetical protein
MDRQTNMVKLTFVVRNFANAPKNGKLVRQNTMVSKGYDASNVTKSIACSWIVNFEEN